MFLLTGIKFRTFIHHRPSTSDLLVKFRDNLNSQPPAIQAQILEDIVKEIKVYEDKIVLELYGSGTLNFEHKKTRHEGGSLLDGCSFRIQFGGACFGRKYFSTFFK